MTAAVVLASFANVAGSAVPVGRERSSIGDPSALQALFCENVKLSVSSVEQVNLSPILLAAPTAPSAFNPTESAGESPAHWSRPVKLRVPRTPSSANRQPTFTLTSARDIVFQRFSFSLGILDPEQDDWQVPRNAMRPILPMPLSLAPEACAFP